MKEIGNFPYESDDNSEMEAFIKEQERLSQEGWDEDEDHQRWLEQMRERVSGAADINMEMIDEEIRKLEEDRLLLEEAKEVIKSSETDENERSLISKIKMLVNMLARRDTDNHTKGTEDKIDWAIQDIDREMQMLKKRKGGVELMEILRLSIEDVKKLLKKD